MQDLETRHNTLLDEVAASHENVKVIDWYGATTGHDDYLQENGVNLTEAGAAAYAAAVHDAVAA